LHSYDNIPMSRKEFEAVIKGPVMAIEYEVQEHLRKEDA